jgi:hypothetical protein
LFGKSLSEYVAFQKPILILIAAVWAVRLALAIVLAMALGQDNIYTTPEFYPPAQGIGVLGLPLPPDGKNLGHAIEHIVVAGAIGFPIIGWLLGSLVLLATRSSARPPGRVSREWNQ